MKKILSLCLALLFVVGCGAVPAQSQSWEDTHSLSLTLAGNQIDVVNSLQLMLEPNAAGGLVWYFPASNGTAGYVLTTDGTGHLTWTASGGGGGGVSSVDVDGGTTGLLFTGGPITTSGVITMSGILSTSNGGTGLATSFGNGALLVGDGTTGFLTPALLTAAKSIAITNGPGSITISTPNFIDDGTSTDAGDATGGHAIVAGGYNNHAGSDFSAILGGSTNSTYNGGGSGILGGLQNQAGFQFSATLGGEGLRTAADHHALAGIFNDTSFDAGINALFSVGNGVDDATRNSAFAVGLDGNVYAGNGVEIYDAPTAGIVTANLNPGSSGDVLTTSAGAATWLPPATATPGSGGTGITSYTLGDMIYSDATNSLAKLPGNTTTTKKFLSQTGTGAVSAAPAWVQPAFTDITGTATIAQGGTGQTTANAAFNALAPSQATNSGKVLGTNGTNTSWVSPATGTLTSIATTAPITGGTITATGTIGITQSATGADGYLSSTDWNTFNGKENVLSFTSPLSRATNTISLSTVPVNLGGTGQTSYTDGQLLIGNSSGNTLTKSTLTAGTGISITNGGGTITVASSGLVNQAKLLFYGDGTDGAVAMDGVNTFAPFATLVGSTYTLTRNVYATTFATSGSVTVKENGFAIFATTSIVNGSGCTISNNGNNAAAGTAGTGSNANGMFTNGKTGGTGVSAISAGSTGTTATVSYGGAGGAGGSDGHAHAGGAGGTVAGPTALQGSIHAFPMQFFGGAFNNTGLGWWNSGGSGGSGGNNCSGCSVSGAGGASAGTLAFYAPTVTNSGAMQCNGGNGGTCAQVADSGGGGGGGGGLVIIVCGTFSGTTPVALGGTHGNGVGTGSNGVDGGTGNVFTIQMN